MKNDTRTRLEEFLRSSGGQVVSGERLAEVMGISRAGIWKIMSELKNSGWEIEASSKKGYRVNFCPMVIDSNDVENLFDDREVLFLEDVDSTNIKAKELLSRGVPSGSVVIAQRQSLGRGRLGRKFSSPYGGLYMSFIYHRDSFIDPMFVTAQASVAACRAIKRTWDLDTQIKWVNDLYFNGRKVSGTLTEGVMDMENGNISSVIIGTGINVNTRISDFPDEIRDIATSLFDGKGYDLRCGEFIRNFGLELDKALKSKDFLADYREKSILIGKDIYVIKNSERVPATCMGIDDDAHLVVRYSSGVTESLNVGEVSTRLRQD